MELRNLKDFYEKQTYYDYEQTQKKTATNFEKRLSELTFFVNIAVFSILLAVITYIFVSAMSAVAAVPLALIVALALYLGCKKGIAKAIKLLLK